MRAADLPATVELLSESKFHTDKIFWLFADRCRVLIADNPSRGLEEAQHAPKLAELCAVSSESPVQLYAEASALLASGYRANGQYQEAEQSYEEAFEHGRDLPRLDLVDIKRRYAALLRVRRSYETALETVNEAMRVYRLDGDITDPHFLGDCYQTRGTIFLQRSVFENRRADVPIAILDYMTALSHLNVKRDPRTYHATIHNLALVLVEAGNSEVLGQALKLLQKAQKSLYYKGHHVAKFKLKWLRGIISIRFGSTRAGELYLYTAREGLTDLGAAYEVALISLDLAMLYQQECRPAWEVLALAEETIKLFEGMCADRETLAALLIWLDAAKQEELTDAIVRSVRKTIGELTKPAV